MTVNIYNLPSCTQQEQWLTEEETQGKKSIDWAHQENKTKTAEPAPVRWGLSLVQGRVACESNVSRSPFSQP